MSPVTEPDEVRLFGGTHTLVTYKGEMAALLQSAPFFCTDPGSGELEHFRKTGPNEFMYVGKCAEVAHDD
jgi:hypothetical protein